MKRHALLIGSATAGLRGVENDVTALSQILVENGFEIATCTGESAARASIITALDALIARCHADDAALVFYSGHGGKIPTLHARATTASTTAPPPRYHRFLVPTDIADSSTGDFRGILDIELAHILARLTDRTRNVTVVLDCCFAEGIMRTPSIPGVQLASKSLASSLPRRILARYRQILNHREQLAQGRELLGVLDPESNPHAVKLFAATAEQSAFERRVGLGLPMGVLTHALVRALARRAGRATTWAELYLDIRAHVARASRGAQAPQLDGPDARWLFRCDEVPTSRVPSIGDEVATALLGPIDGTSPIAERASIVRDMAEPPGTRALIVDAQVVVRLSDGTCASFDMSPDEKKDPARIEPLRASSTTRAYVELRQRARGATTYWSVFHIDPQQRVTSLTRSARTGIQLRSGEAYVLGRREGDLTERDSGIALSAASVDSSTDDPVLHTFLVIVTVAPYDLRALETSAMERYRPEDDEPSPTLAEFAATLSTRGSANDEEFRYAAVRIDIRVCA